MTRFRLLIAFVLTACFLSGCVAQGQPAESAVQTCMVEMRDGVKLATFVALPTAGEGPWPVVLSRTPYNAAQGIQDRSPYVRNGLVRVVQDMRGRFDSEGVDTVFLTDGWGELQDGYDTLEWIVAQRQRLNDMFAELISDLPGIHPPQRTEGIEHSYWLFPIRVEEEVLGASPATFREAVNAEGVPISGAWIGQPLYSFDALRERIVFGSSEMPFDIGRDRPVEYLEGLCPTAELGIKQLCSIRIHERFTEADVRDCANGIRKVAEAFLSRR